MKVLYMGQAPYRYLPADFSEHYQSVVNTPYGELVEPEKMHASLHAYVEELLHAARSGFDGIGVSEHSQSSYDISPNPDMAAAIVAHTTQVEGLATAITVLGRSLGKAREPLKVAEEYALLDVLSGGRLIAGMPVGLSYDANLNGGIPPIETRLRAREGRALLERAWSATEPFAWTGKYSRYPMVNIWPRPVQQPRPPFWVPGGGTPGTLAEVLEREDVFTYLSWFGATVNGRAIFNRFWQMADEQGRDRNPYRLAFLQNVCVADTDAEAERLYSDHVQRHFRNAFGAIPAPSFALPGYADIRGVEAMMRNPGDLGLAPKLHSITFRELTDERAVIAGSPATVIEQITEFVQECRIGNLLVMLHVGSMPHELARHNISMFASEVLPHLRGIWEDEGWEHRWWPTGIGGRSSEGSLAGAQGA
jgi:alkanesulfonate monooxygenase SsuD/methylene tetrahydromethanopterin reductase-like flavin-dependent oxidoreductase (luciferase family)